MCTSCLITKEYPVEYDYNFIGAFDNYQSFSFVNRNNGFEDNTNVIIKNTIKNHMELIGFTYDNENPKILVNFYYITDSINFNGYKQPDMIMFIKNKDDEEKEKEEYKKQKLIISDGTFVINFTEKESYKMVWQGYTTDLYKDQIFTDPRKTRIAVLSILKSYGHLPK